MNDYRIIRKHVLEITSLHGALDSLQRKMIELMDLGYEPLGGVSVYHDYILQTVVKYKEDLND